MDAKKMESLFRTFGGGYNCGCPCQSWCPQCILQALNLAVAEEREACAKVAEEEDELCHDDGWSSRRVAAAIRARGDIAVPNPDLIALTKASLGIKSDEE